MVQDRVIDKIQSLGHVTSYTGISNDHNPPLKLDRLCYDRESNYDSHGQRSGLSLYGQDPALTVHHPPALARSVGAIVTQVSYSLSPSSPIYSLTSLLQNKQKKLYLVVKKSEIQTKV